MSQQNNLVESGHKRHDVTDNRCNMPENDDIEDNDEELDPRVQDELEKLNKHTDEINKLELQLEDANCLFRTLLTDSTHQLKALSQKIGKKKVIDRYVQPMFVKPSDKDLQNA